MKNIRQYWRWGVVAASLLLFLALKLFTLEFHLGDPTVYWYMAQVLPQGIVPYRDFFFADPPVLVLFLVPIVAAVGSQYLVLQFVPFVLEAAVSLGLAFILKKQGSNFWWAAPVVYLGSFTIMATSDYGTGMQLASAWLVCALLLLQHKKFFWTGVFLAVAALTKMYMGAAVLGVLSFSVWQREWRALRQIIFGGVVSTFMIVLPWVIISNGAIVADIFWHQLQRPAGLSKTAVLLFFLQREWALLVLGGVVAWVRRNSVFAWVFAAELLFFVLFQDIYYAYLGILILPLTALVLNWESAAEKLGVMPQHLTRVRDAVIVFAVLWFVLGQGFYWSGTFHDGKFEQHAAVVQLLAQQPKDLPLYGSHELVPLMALKTGRPVFENIIDSNGQTFGSGAQDRAAISQRAAEHGVLLLSRGQLHPLSGGPVSLHQAYFSDEIYRDHCQVTAHLLESSRTSTDILVLSYCKSTP